MQDKAAEKGGPSTGRSGRWIVWESLSTSPGTISSGLAQPQRMNCKGSRCQGRLVAQPGTAWPAEQEQSRETSPLHRARRREQDFNNSAGKGTNKHKLARNKSGWQLSDSSRASSGVPDGHTSRRDARTRAALGAAGAARTGQAGIVLVFYLVFCQGGARSHRLGMKRHGRFGTGCAMQGWGACLSSSAEQFDSLAGMSFVTATNTLT